jgi:lipid-A-disaccharide synthase
MVTRAYTILLVAGEASGDAHGADLIAALRRQNPAVRCIGVGGPKMRAEGQEQLFDLSVHAVVGLIEVLKHYFKFRRFFHQVLDLARLEQPDAVVLIDYPGFNLRLAAKLRKLIPDSKLIYYISPQVWAWKAGRAFTMAQVLDRLLVLFPFEVEWFGKKVPGFSVEWVGHPLADRVKNDEGGELDEQRIALLPGSRRAEIGKHLPVLWEAARKISLKKSGLTFVWIAPNAALKAFGEKLVAGLESPNFHFEVHADYQRTHLSRCGLALVASGTASLECAFLRVPQIVIYKVNRLTYWVGRAVVKLPYLSMVNVLAGKPVVPELIQDDFTPAKLAEKALGLLEWPERRRKMQAEMAEVIAGLGGPGASGRAAAAVLKELEKTAD